MIRRLMFQRRRPKTALREILETLGEIMTVQETILADVTAIKTALVTIADSQTTLAADVAAAVAAVQAAVTAGTVVDQPTLDALAAVAADSASAAKTLSDTVTSLDTALHPVTPPPAA